MLYIADIVHCEEGGREVSYVCGISQRSDKSKEPESPLEGKGIVSVQNFMSDAVWHAQ